MEWSWGAGEGSVSGRVTGTWATWDVLFFGGCACKCRAEKEPQPLQARPKEEFTAFAEASPGGSGGSVGLLGGGRHVKSRSLWLAATPPTAGYLFASLVPFSSSSELSPSVPSLCSVSLSFFRGTMKPPLFSGFYLGCPWLPQCLASAPGVGLLCSWVPGAVKSSTFLSWSLGGLLGCCLPPGHHAREALKSDKQERVFVTKSGVWPLAAQKPVERPGWWKGKFASFWMPANGDRGRRYTCAKADSPAPTMLHQQSGGKNFCRWREGAPCRNSRVSSDAHLQTGLQRSDQRHLGCFKYSQSSGPGLFPFL